MAKEEDRNAEPEMTTSPPKSRTRQSQLTAWASILAAFFLLAAVTLAHVLARPVEPNENMYIAASVLAMDQTMYQDFAFVQMPYLPRHYAFLYSLFGTEQFLLHSRIASWFAFMVMTLAVAGIAWHYSRDAIIAITGMIVLVCSESIIVITGECSNYTLAACCSLIAFWIFIARRDYVGSLTSGLLLAICVCIKLYYAVLVPAFLLALWFRPHRHVVDRRERLWMTAAMLGGLALGAFPAFLQLIAAPDLFMFNNLGFHRWKTLVYWEIGYGDRMTLHSRIQLAKTCLQHASQMWLFYTALLAAGVLLRYWRRIGDWYELAIACCLALTCLVASLVPVPAWPQYFAMPIPFALVIALQLASRYHAVGRPMMCAAALTGIIVAGPYYGRAMAKSLRADGRTPSIVHSESRNLIANIGKEQPLVAATRTLVPLEGGARIYPEFALSGFMFELSDHLPFESIERYHVTAPQALTQLLRDNPPDAIITRDIEIDRPLIQFATRHRYRKIQNTILDVSLWLPPPLESK